MATTAVPRTKAPSSASSSSASVSQSDTGDAALALPVLAALGDIAARLTQAGPTDLVAHDVLERARVLLDAVDCSVWLRTGDGQGGAPGGLARSWGVGDQPVSADEALGALESMALASPGAGGKKKKRDSASSAGLRAAEMSFGLRNVGVLVVRTQRQGALSSPHEHFIHALASMLASFIASTERSRRLEGDLQNRVQEVEAQRRFTEAIVDSLPLGLYVIDREYRIMVWNHKREIGMQGVLRGEAIGRTIFEILHRQPAEVLRREFDEVFATGRIQQFQMESKTSGDLRTYRLSKIPMRDASGTVTHVITIGEDITDWVESRERVAQNEKLAAIGRLAAGVMHEINNPLATIAACAESMSMNAVSEADTPEFLKIIEAEVQRCKRIIDGLLDFSRPQPLQRQPVDVNSVVERTLFLLKHHGRFKQLKVELGLTNNLPSVYASSEQLVQVMIALLMNAADAMPPFGRVAIRTSYVDRTSSSDTLMLKIEIEDEGTGIPRAHMARIFEPFYTTKEPGRGTGLGLAICYGIVAEHGGRIEVESEPGKGSTFRVVLPVDTEHLEGAR